MSGDLVKRADLVSWREQRVIDIFSFKSISLFISILGFNIDSDWFTSYTLDLLLMCTLFMGLLVVHQSNWSDTCPVYFKCICRC